MHRLGFLTSNVQSLNIDDPDELIFRQALRDLGYIEGQNLIIEWRQADGHNERLPQLVAELVAVRVDVIVVSASPAAIAASAGTQTIPIVFVNVNDPVAQGLVASLAHPGANVTGLSTLSAGISGKRIDLFREMLPGARRVGVIWAAANPGQVLVFNETRAVAESIGLEVRSHGVQRSADIDDALAAIDREGADSFLVLPSVVYQTSQLVDFAAAHRLPAMYPQTPDTVAGGLMSFSPPYHELRRRAAAYIDKILHGANPGDLPVEQPVGFDFAINSTTAASLGLAIPDDVRLHVTQVFP